MDFGGAGAVGAVHNAGNVDLMSWCVPAVVSGGNCVFHRCSDSLLTLLCLASFNRYMEIPPMTRLYLTGAFLTTAACAVDIISPFSLYFNWDLVFSQGQIWRLLTSYLFFGVFSIDFLFHMYFLVRCC
jgi:hypothetical protein